MQTKIPQKNTAILYFLQDYRIFLPKNGASALEYQKLLNGKPGQLAVEQQVLYAHRRGAPLPVGKGVFADQKHLAELVAADAVIHFTGAVFAIAGAVAQMVAELFANVTAKVQVSVPERFQAAAGLFPINRFGLHTENLPVK